MPIFDIEIVRRAGEAVAPGLATRLADALGGALGAAPGKVWVRLRSLAPEAYAENGEGDGRASPIFVTMTASAPPEGEALDRLVAQVTQAVAGLAGRPAENVHVLLQPAAKGRIAFGGKVVK
ncbi:MAG TPA: tautomerase family protein [Usitatibacteraceae bacterium]|nr:tautomerase family protein [Usitatibacteraceae bacterium]